MTSAFALVGLCSLAAVETGGCSNSSKSLASVTRTGLPLLAAVLRGPIAQLSLKKLSRAAAPKEREGDSDGAQPFVEHGLAPLSELVPHCGRYEFKDDGKVVAWDALVSSEQPERVALTLTQRDHSLQWSRPTQGVWLSDRVVVGKHQHVQLHARELAKLPPNCRELEHSVRSVVMVAESL